MKKPHADMNKVPEWQMQNFCMQLEHAIERFYADPENERRYQEWLKKKKKLATETV